MARPLGTALPVVVLVAASSCATTAPTAGKGPPDVQHYRVTGTVLESPDHGPHLCNVVMESMPPQCDGLEISGWDWAKVDAESAVGTTWGRYTLIGTYDGERFTLTEPATPPSGSPSGSQVDRDPFDTPCEEPEAGWRVRDESKYSLRSQELAQERARSAPEFAGMWVDYPHLDGAAPTDPDDSRLKTFVLNVRFTGNLDGREEWIREVWGGALCISGATHTVRALSKIEKELRAEHGEKVLSSNVDEATNQVELELYSATDELQAEQDEKYGEGVVRVDGWLQPLD